MKNIDIKNMNAKQRLILAEAATKYYGRLILIDTLNYEDDSYCTTLFKNIFREWYKVTKNMYLMRGITTINEYSILN